MTAPTALPYSFASDNYSGIHPDMLQAISAANHGHEPAYGYDSHTTQLQVLIKSHFGDTATVYPVFNGTGANIAALTATLPRFGSIICTITAHINCDESNAPQYISGIKLIPIDTTDGKLTPAMISSQLYRLGNEHASQPSCIYISQTTELGTCYSLDEIRAITALAKSHGLYTYIDGARLSNACATLGCTLQDIADTGVDILSLGGTKNGMMIGECIVVLNPTLDEQMKFLRKNHMQLGSKLRFIAAQFNAWLQSGLYLSLATHSNAMASYLADNIKGLNGVSITQAVQSNAVFVILPKSVTAKLHQDFHFYDWNYATGEIRLMMSFDTTTAQVDNLIDKIKQYLVEG
ncbi:MAG: low specificity L-threonine aldolase [Moraxella sp.]|nr:low specificity L-threonine aldolase [Moraxella sp.]